MKTIQFCQDGDYLASLVGDKSPLSNRVGFILKQDSDTAGVITFDFLNYILWVPHITILKPHRGDDSFIWGKLAIEYMNKHFGAKKFLALTPYLAAKKYAEKVGFKQIAILSQSIMQDDKLLDQYMMEKTI